jgi:APA family basic amino acid/polyamine antiporter
MYHLLSERPVHSLLGLLTMFSGLLIYAVFRKREDHVPVAASSGTE